MFVCTDARSIERILLQFLVRCSCRVITGQEKQSFGGGIKKAEFILPFTYISPSTASR